MDSCETETDGYAGRDVGDSVGGAVDHVGGPRLVVVAAAVGRTRHLAVAGVELAAVAQGEAVRPVRTQEIRRRCFHLAEQHQILFKFFFKKSPRWDLASKSIDNGNKTRKKDSSN